MKKLSNITENIRSWLFNSVVSDNLIYNTCWEDPRIDRQLLQLDSNSKVVMLTSAGCNALDYLLDDVQKIHCVDANSTQNALLEFKKSLFKNKNYQQLWDFFGKGQKQDAELFYQQKLRHFLPDLSQQYWDRQIRNFVPKPNHPSFYFSGTSGQIVLKVYNHIQRKGLKKLVIKLLNANSLEEQTYYFEEIEPQLWNDVMEWLIQQRATMTMLGVPRNQRQMIEDEYQDGLLGFIRQSLRHVFTELPIHDNYFWRVYLTGSYSYNCCPNYLLKQHYETLSQSINRIDTHTSTLLAFLRQNPGTYSHFILLDHQDWIAHTHPTLLEEEWKQILDNAKSDSRILFRSAGSSLDFLPNFVSREVEFQPTLTKKAHQKDRVGTYESTHLGIVQ
jgi:S-adenosylmethionine-diacylglycerol 3-amino-3-carboxypropyl transferase